MKVGELCAGYGGISMGLRLAGEDVDLRWLAEFDPTLDPLHPAGVPNLGDITQIDWSTVERVDLLTAGFPCQPFSAAGSQLAEADPRYLWPAVRDAIAALLPPRVLLENVRNLVGMRKGEIWARILDDLTGLGYDVTWLTLGACRVGAAHHRHRVFALATHTQWSEPRVTRLDVQECGAPLRRTIPDACVILLPSPSASSYGSNQGGAAGRIGPVRHSLDSMARLDLLPTPTGRDGDGRGTGDAGYWDRRTRTGRTNGFPLDATVALLPSPKATDSEFGGRQLRTDGRTPSGYGADLIDLAASRLLPSPRASDGINGGPGQRGSSGDLAPPSATQPVNFDRFQAAVDRHAAIFGPPPAPTEPNRNGAPRLSAAFAEWLMCIPAGHVTDALSRKDALKAIGNGVCPPQLAAAWRLLTNPLSIDKPNDTSIGSGAMTQSTTSADVKEIQDRNAAARGRVIDATMALGVTVDPALIQAAMMELAAVWREEAAHVTTAKRKGHVSIAKEYTQAAARLAGFAVGLTTRPVETPAESLAIVDANVRAMSMTPLKCEACDLDMHRCPGCGEPVNHGEVACAKCNIEHAWADDLTAALPEGDPVAAVFTWPDPLPPLVPSDEDLARLAASLQPPPPEGDPVAAVFSSPTSLTGDEPIGTQVVVGGIEFTKIGTDPFGNEENALRDIIGPLGASSVTATIDHPFTNPGVPWLNRTRAVEVIPFRELPIIAAATTARSHVSHSYVQTYESCSLSAMLRDASRTGLIGASRPSWSTIGGNAFHNAVEMIERLALSGVEFSVEQDLNAVWEQHFEAAVKEKMDELVGTPYADSATWYISNRGKEGFDWWRVEGAKMLGLYVKHHTSAWRAANATFLLQDKTPVIELEYTMTLRSLDGERGLTAQGFIDKATLDMSTYSLTVLDYKTGARDPESTFQLGEYGHALLMAMGIPGEPPDRPILGRYWLARKGIYTDPVPVVTRHPLTELQYRYDNADRGTKARVFTPHVTNLCKSCSVTDYCPAQAGRS